MPTRKKLGSEMTLFEGGIDSPFFETNPLPIWIFDRKSFRFLAVNDAAVRAYGYSRSEFLKMKLSEIRPVEDLPRFNASASSFSDSFFQPMGEWRHKLKSGVVIDVEIFVSAVEYRGKKAGLTIVHDVTERKRAEAALMQALEWQEAVFQGSRDAVFISDADSKFISVNEAACELTGYTKTELLRMCIPDLHDDMDLDAYKVYHRKIMQGEPALTEAFMLRKDGTKIRVEFNNRKMMLSGKPHMHTIARNITERKKAEEDLELYALLFKHLSEMILFIREDDRKIIEANEAAQKAFGYTRDEMLSLTVYDLIPPENRPELKKRFSAEAFRGETVETVNRRKDGSIFHSAVRQQRLTLDGRRVIVGFGSDLTEQRIAQEALEKSEAKYRELIESMPDGYYLSTSAGKFIDVNPAFCRMLGYTKDEMLAMNIPETLYFEPAERRGETMYTGFSPVTEVYRLKSKDGSEVWLEDYARYGRDETGKIVNHEGICRDVTDRKRAQEAVELSEARLRAVIENSTDTIVFLDADGRQLECLNPVSFKQITGHSAAERNGKSIFELINPEEVEDARRKLAAASKLGGPVRSENRIKRNDGSWRWVEWTSRNMLSDPLISAIVVNMRDVEERKSAERLLVESEERYRLLVDNFPDSIIVFTDGVCVYVNPATLGPIRASSADQLIGRPITDFIHPDSLESTLARVTEMLRNQKALPNTEIKLNTIDGGVIEVEVRSAPVTYLGKPSIQAVLRNITQRRQVERQLQLQSVALNTAANGIVMTDIHGDIVWANPAFESLTGYEISEAMGKNLRDLIKSGRQSRDFYANMWSTILTGNIWRGEIINKKKNGTLYSEEMTIAPVFDEKGEITHFVAVKQDISERKSLQEQLLQSQKLESIGQLAGGVAHDYNNILGVVIGYAELLKSKFVDDYEAQKPIDAILTAATRASDLTRQLLAFARKEMISPRIINVNTSVENIDKMLRRIIGENIDLIFEPGTELWNVRIDPTQLDQLLVNLAANARDAIKRVGSITIRTCNVAVDARFAARHPGLSEGEFVKISFSDTGIGMDEETVKRVFEPFFTTKQKGQGTGLGLSTVYGIVNQNEGSVFVSSKPGDGTTFDIYLPRFYGEPDEELGRPSEADVRGTETVLVVEDQPEMLELTKASLEKYGYHVLTAQGPDEAITLCESSTEPIHILLTDVIMPVMSGKDLSAEVARLKPDVKTLFMSGYTANELDPEGILDAGLEFIQKPFTPVALAKKISEVLKS